MEERNEDEFLLWMVQSGRIPGICDHEIWEDCEEVRLRNPNKRKSFQSADYTFHRLYFDQDEV